MKLSVLIHSAEEGGYWAEVPALPGCVSEGDTLDEITANIREAVEGWLEVAAERTARAIEQVTETETTLLSIDVRNQSRANLSVKYWNGMDGV